MGHLTKYLEKTRTSIVFKGEQAYFLEPTLYAGDLEIRSMSPKSVRTVPKTNPLITYQI